MADLSIYSTTSQLKLGVQALLERVMLRHLFSALGVIVIEKSDPGGDPDP